MAGSYRGGRCAPPALHPPLRPGAGRDRARRRCSGTSTRISAKQMKPLGDGFIKLIKMIIAPIIFCTVVHGIAAMQDMKKVGRVGFKALHLLRDRHDVRARRRPHRRQRAATRRRHEHRRGDDRRQGRSRTTSPRPRSRAPCSSCSTSSPRPSSAPSRTATSCRCCCFALLFAFGLQSLGAHGEVAAQADRNNRARAVQHRWLHHDALHPSAPSAPWRSPSASTASRRLLSARRPHGRVLSHLPPFRVRRARRRSRASTASRLYVHPLHQGRAAHRARHVVVGNAYCRA